MMDDDDVNTISFPPGLHPLRSSGTRDLRAISVCMIPSAALRPYTCARCLRAIRRPRGYANAASQPKEPEAEQYGQHTAKQGRAQEGGGDKEEGALTRRLREMSEAALESGGHGAIKAIEEAGFSADLKAQLEQRIAAANLRSSEADLPASASRHTRDLATTDAWTGTESIHDASLRMLNDARKPMKLGRPPRAPGLQMPKTIDTGHKRNREQRGVRLANARDRSGVYVSVKTDVDMDAQDREKQLQELKDRFDPNARVMVPRGKGMNVERDHNASSPFIDTTEYFMNKIIQKQEIVPPWIEKQQELTSAASKFRSRLRAEWKRHAARMIASKGGSLQDQIRRAEAYAKAELSANPLKKKQEVFAVVEGDDQLSQISLSGELKATPPLKGPTDTTPIITEDFIAQKDPFDLPEAITLRSTIPKAVTTSAQTIQVPIDAPTSFVPPASFPFRDPDWECIESGYHTVAIADLNSKARSYNLQAPELAKRPYFNLQRELNSCFADVAPQLAQAILDRARAPPKKIDAYGQATGEKGLLANLVGDPVRIRDERTTKQYGFRQFWKDLWGTEKSQSPY